MTLGCDRLAALLETRELGLIPEHDPGAVRKSGEASLTLRLGRWFATIRESRKTHYVVYSTDKKNVGLSDADEKLDFIPFGSDFVLHPGRFVLGVTLEWIELSHNFCGKVVGKSYVGRRGLIIETAPGIHPLFSGCLTLEMANVGEAPILLRPGMSVCQVYLEELTSAKTGADVGSPVPKRLSRKSPPSGFAGKRRPSLGPSKIDDTLADLSKPLNLPAASTSDDVFTPSLFDK